MNTREEYEAFLDGLDASELAELLAPGSWEEVRDLRIEEHLEEYEQQLRDQDDDELFQDYQLEELRQEYTAKLLHFYEEESSQEEV